MVISNLLFKSTFSTVSGLLQRVTFNFLNFFFNFVKHSFNAHKIYEY